MTVDAILKAPIMTYIKAYRRPFALGLFFLMVTNFLDAIHPLIIKEALDSLEGATSPWVTVKWGGLFLLVVGTLAFTRYLWRWHFGRYHTQAAEDIRQKLFFHLIHLGPHYYQKQPTGEQVSLMVNDVQAYRQAIGPAILIGIDGLMISLFVIPMMWSLNPDWMLKTLIFIPLLPVAMRWIMSKINTYFKEQQDKLAELSNFVQETLSGIKIIKSFAQENSRIKQFINYNSSLVNISQKLALVDAAFGPTMELAVAIGSAILIFIAAPDLISGTLSIGTFIAFQRYITKMVWPMTAFGLSLSQYQKGMASFARIKEVLTQKNPVTSGDQSILTFQKLELQQVKFYFPQATLPTLQNINLTLLPQQKLGLMGPVGSGKSTLCQLLIRLYDPTAGLIQLNSLPVANFEIAQLRRCIQLLPQEPVLFSMSIRENLKLANPEATDETLWQILKHCAIEDEIRNLPQGLDSMVGERGVNFSGGQKQRLCLARALVAQPEVLILDDPLSAVDIHTEEKIIQALAGMNLGLIIISHRLNVLKNCAHLIVLNDGQIEAQGSADYLAQHSPTFQKMSALQESV